jgi:uncharacterized OB-fold protein
MADADALIPLPQLDELNTFFWTSGADGLLRFQKCRSCGYWLHPPGVICPKCLSADIAPEAVSGTATVAALTVNAQPWVPGMEVPYVLAIVELDEQEGLRLTTNLINVDPRKAHIGQRVRVVFKHREDVYLPLFEPIPEGDA